jgi:peptidyl-prolyl cis-trans isomerase D
LPENYRDSIFNAQPGYVAGPYYEGEAYKMARLIDFVQVPDSVRARHILISLSVQRDEARAKVIADSLKTLIENGQSFEFLANTYSSDQSNKQIGGDLGWFSEGTMVKPFSDAVFSGKTGDILVVKTRFGYHVIKIEQQSPKVKKAEIAFMIRQVMPSDETYQTIYSEAVQFRADADNVKEFRDLYLKKNITPRFATDFAQDVKQLPGLEDSREIIRWAYENEENSISQIFDLNDMYIIAALTDVKLKGVAKMENVKTEIEIAIKKQKKLDKLKETVADKTSGASNIDDAATALNSEVRKAENVRFSNPYVNGAGLEPKIVALAFQLEPEKISEPVIGENSVFIIQVSDKNIPESPDVASAAFRLKYGIDSRAAFEGYEALKEKAGIEDKRIKFY